MINDRRASDVGKRGRGQRRRTPTAQVESPTEVLRCASQGVHSSQPAIVWFQLAKVRLAVADSLGDDAVFS